MINNRIVDAIDKAKVLIDENPQVDSDEYLIEYSDAVAFGELPTLAVAEGLLSPEEGTILARILATWSTHSTTAEKVVFMHFANEMVKHV